MRIGLVLVLGAVAIGLIIVARPAPPPAPPQLVPESAVSVVLGMFRPVAVQALWIEAAAALADRRDFDAVVALRMLDVADPDNRLSASYRAHVIAHDIAGREPTAPARCERILEAVAILDRAIASHPGDPEPCLELGSLLMEPWIGTPEFSATFQRRRRVTPLHAAADVLDLGLRRAPGSEVLRGLAGEAHRLRALEMGSRKALAEDVRAELALAAAAVGPLAGRADATISTKLVLAWHGFVDALCAGSAVDVEAAALGLHETLSSPVLGTGAVGEIGIARALTPWIFEFASRDLDAAAPERALSVVRAVGRILELPGAPGPVGPVPSGRIVSVLDRLERVGVLDKVHRADLERALSGREDH